MKVQFVLAVLFGIAMNSAAQAQESSGGYYFGECKNGYVGAAAPSSFEDSNYSDEADFKDDLSNGDAAPSNEAAFSKPSSGVPTQDEAELKAQFAKMQRDCESKAPENNSASLETWEDFEWSGYRPGPFLKY